jgi:MFS family permease
MADAGAAQAPVPFSRQGQVRAVVLVAFAAFGVVWGIYAASVPAIKAATGASDGSLGLALSCTGLTALPAMFWAGRLADRLGRHALPVAALALAVGAPAALFTHSVPALVGALLVFGICSGVYDVVINHAAVQFEGASGRRVLNQAHSVFSVGLLVASVGTGALRGAGVRPGWLLVGTGAVVLAGALPAWRALAGLPAHAAAAATGDRAADRAARRRGRSRLGPVIWALGGLGVLALLVESGVQQWSAVFLENTLHAAPAVAGLGPAVFAAAEAAGRASGHRLIERLGDLRLLACAGLIAAPGAILTGLAGGPLPALLAIALAGIGISVGAPTLYGLSGRSVPAADRGRAIATVSGVAYVGLLGGPGVVGEIAGASSLRLAIGLLAAAAIALTIGAVLLARLPAFRAVGRAAPADRAGSAATPEAL